MRRTRQWTRSWGRRSNWRRWKRGRRVATPI
jgi:hypothetical protein